MDTYYRTSSEGAFFKDINDLKHPGSLIPTVMHAFADQPTLMRKALLAPLKLMLRTLETISQPLMGHLVPTMKVGVFTQLAQDWNNRNPVSTPYDRAEAMTQFWDSVDNRMGQMVYDNVMWKNWQKDLGFILTRSQGWNLGALAEIIGGGIVDTAKFLNDIVHGRHPEVTTRMGYVLGMTAITMMVGAVMTYLATGKGPQERKDYFYPPDGVGGRRSIPGYARDYIGLYHAPLTTIENKANPLLTMGLQMITNKDYYGHEIYNPEFDDSIAAAYGNYLFNAEMPFSIQSFQRQRDAGVDPLDQAASFLGFGAAPGWVTDPEREERYQHRQNVRDYRTREREPNRMEPFGP
jgi:hypothetical protein